MPFGASPFQPIHVDVGEIQRPSRSSTTAWQISNAGPTSGGSIVRRAPRVAAVVGADRGSGPSRRSRGCGRLMSSLGVVAVVEPAERDHRAVGHRAMRTECVVGRPGGSAKTRTGADHVAPSSVEREA